MKTGTSIAIAVVVGVVGYLAYKKFKEKEDLNKLREGGNSSDGGSGSGAGAGTSTGSSALVNPNIRQLQTWLQITADGVAGKITNGKVEYYWSAYDNTFDAERMFKEGYPNLQKAKGVVTEANALYYLNILKAAQSPRQTYEVNKGKGAAAAANAADRTKKSNAIKAAYTGKNYLMVNKDVSILSVYYDVATKTYKSTGKMYAYKQGDVFIIDYSSWDIKNESRANEGNVKIEAISSDGYLIVNINPILPLTAPDIKLKVDPNDLSVLT